MNDFIKQLEELNLNKPGIIQSIRNIATQGVSNTQAQNLREYSVQTQSIDEILLYIEYQIARDGKLKEAGNRLIALIKEHQTHGIEVVRYLLGTFTRWVMIESKKEQPKRQQTA